MKKILRCIGVIFIVLSLFFIIYLNQHYTVPILMYHSLDKAERKDTHSVDPAIFYQQMKFIKEKSFNVILLDDYCKLLQENKPQPRNSIIITFDDGYKDNLKGVEVLGEFNYPATIFFIVEFIGKEGYLSKEDIEGFSKESKVRIGSHTMRHTYLPDKNNDKIIYEIADSKKQLEELFIQKVKTISYPLGGFNERVIEEVKSADYLCACTTNRGFSQKLDRFALRRIKVTNRDSGWTLWVKLSGYYNFFKRAKNPF